MADVRCDEAFAWIAERGFGDADPAWRDRVEPHLAACPACREAAAQLRVLGRSVERLRGDVRAQDEAAALPPDLQSRLFGLGRWHCRRVEGSGPDPIPFGIRDEFVSAGDHLAYFWESAEEFDGAVGFLEAGLRGDDHIVVFGHDEANARVLQGLRRRSLDPERLGNEARLSVVGGGPTEGALLAATGGRIGAALDGGAPAVRLLGNLGWGRPGWPADEEILAFEAKVTGVARKVPLVVVCMYDVEALPGRILLKGGIEVHPHTWRRGALRRNEHCVPHAV